ncbi:hypothetical protein [Porphyromonas vaginalis]|uniref:hypothetical protein n=1 Tax=Porphyromonas vaginalis TaxID=3044325 RepID=UPI00260F815E|nr:hypothetical protein [Porphyromonas vaginalis]
MTPQGLTKLKELATEVDELLSKTKGLVTRIRNFYGYEEDVLDWDAHMQLLNAGAAMKDAVPCMKDALLGLQKAYNAEEEDMKFNNVLPDDQDDDER